MEGSGAVAIDNAEYKQWIERVLARPVRDLRRISAGSTRGMYFVETDGPQYVLRIGDSGGSTSGTELDLLREAEAYEALRDTGVPIPELIGVRDGGDAFLMSRAAGTHDLSVLDAETRAAVCGEYVECLAKLHQQDAARFALSRFRRPKTNRDHARNEVAVWEGIFRKKARRLAPLAECAFAVLRQTAPEYGGPLVLCHGDVGPWNFMFDQGKVTALIDWEWSHLGDPLDDIAGWLFRGHEWLASGGDFREQVTRWSRITGFEPDAARLKYYRAILMLRFYVSCFAQLDTGSDKQDRLPVLRIQPALEIKLGRALAELLGEDMSLPARPELKSEPLAKEAAKVLKSNLEGQILPALTDAEAQRRCRSAIELAEHLGAVDCYGAEIRTQEAADVRELLIGTPADTTDITGRLVELARGNRSEQLRLLRYYVRRGARMVMLWPAAVDRAFAEPVLFAP